MTDQHPIIPPPELVEEWKRTAPHPINEREHYHYITLCAAQWGADQELKACCQSLYNRFASPVHQAQFLAQELRDWLRAARRPQPPSLKEQAIEALDRLCVNHLQTTDHEKTIRRALEALDD